jgi:LCP family protein required for cell wall assembly
VRRSGHGGTRRRAGRRRWLRVVAITTGATLVAGCGAGYLYYRHLNGNIQSGTRNLTDQHGERTAPNAKGQTPLNILMIGTDSRASKEDVDLGGSAADAARPGLADVQMLLHVSADRTNASMISIPRDTLVDIPACHDEKGVQHPALRHHPINEALAQGGPGCVLGTWVGLTHLDIDHYLMVDFAGVVQMADAIGGVPVCVDRNMDDRYRPGIGGTGLKLPKGTSVVRHDQALQWLRVRDAWGSDINRTKAQHLYLSSMMRELKSKGALDDPGRLMSLAEAATRALSVDRELADLTRLYDLGQDLRQVPTERTTSLTVPVLPDPANPRARLVLDQAGTAQIWRMLHADTPLDGQAAAGAAAPPSAASPGPASPAASVPSPSAPSDPGGVAVTVRNASGTRNRADEIRTALVKAGFARAVAVTGGGSQPVTTLTYGAGQLTRAQTVAAALALPSTALHESGGSRTLALVIGADWPGGTAFAPAPAPTAVPASVRTERADDASACMTVNPQGGIYTW